MSTQDLYDSARAVINQHNDVVGATSPASVDPEEFLENLKIRGYTSEEGLSSMSHEKIAACLPIPISTKEPMLGLAAAIAKAFRKNPEGDTPEAAKSVSGKPYVSSKKAERMTPRELLEHFDPTEPESAAAQRLDKIVNSANFWIPGANSPVDVDLSLKSLEVVKKFGPHKDGIFIVGKESYETYRVGQQPDMTVLKNPVWPDRPLRGFICDQMNRSWEGVSEDVMSFVILGVESGAIKQSVSEAHNILDMALETNGFERLKQRYATVKVAFEKAKKKGEQPKTTMDLKPVVQEASRSGRPFDKPRKVVWLTPTGGTFNNDACVVVWNGQFQQVPKNPWYQ